MRAFVIRPFRASSGIDFKAVHESLVAPALAQTGYVGGTTEAIVESGIIHESMFLELVDADLVIADVSIHNANVFYELGIRHALRPSTTVLLRAQRSGNTEPAVATNGELHADRHPAADLTAPVDGAAQPNGHPRQNGRSDLVPRAEIPFDIQGVRYFAYDPDRPEVGVSALVDAIRDTAAARAIDSPVYRLLPDLVVDAARLQTVPFDLEEQIELYRLNGSAGDLRLLAEDVLGLRFEERALRLIAAAQTSVGDKSGARESWESIRSRRPNDFDANHQLATIFARIAEPVRSEQAIARALLSSSLGSNQRAELLALRGSNLKDRWQKQWAAWPAGADRQRVALRSPELDEAIAAYTSGFRSCLDNYYAGLNALALTSIQLSLVQAQPDVWLTNHPNQEASALRLDDVRRLREWLLSAVRASLDNRSDQYRCEGLADEWLNSSIADYEIVSCASEERTTAAYQRAAQGLSPAAQSSVVRQLQFFLDLGFRADLAGAIIDTLVPAKKVKRKPPHVLVFSGHMIDGEDRPGRFPTSIVDDVRKAIAKHVNEQKEKYKSLVGFAGGSDGGDILFHECCDDAKIETEVFLPVPDRQYRGTAMRPPGSSASWLHRYINVLERSKQNVHTLNPAVGLPSWVDLRREVSSWPRVNRWMLHHALARTGSVTLLALWDGRPAYGPGGVSNMVELAQKYGADIDIIDINLLKKGVSTMASSTAVNTTAAGNAGAVTAGVGSESGK